jgi:hypothetical protein
MPSLFDLKYANLSGEGLKCQKKIYFRIFETTTFLRKKACENLNQKCYRPQEWAPELKYLLEKYRANRSDRFSDPITFFQLGSDPIRYSHYEMCFRADPITSDHKMPDLIGYVIGLQLVKQIPDQIETKNYRQGIKINRFCPILKLTRKLLVFYRKQKKDKINFRFLLMKVSLDDSLVDSKIYAKQSYLEDFFFDILLLTRNEMKACSE